MSRTRFGLYQPCIEDRNVRRLYQLKTSLNEALQTKLPMTVVLNRILDQFFETCPTVRAAFPPWLAMPHPHRRLRARDRKEA